MNTNYQLSFFSAASKVLKALGHPERLKIIEFLKSGEKTVGQIQTGIGLSQPITSQHLRYMKNRNILESRRDGTHFYYYIASDLIHKLLECVNSCKITLDSGERQMTDFFPESKMSD